jgi:hypothetical protein
MPFAEFESQNVKKRLLAVFLDIKQIAQFRIAEFFNVEYLPDFTELSPNLWK